MKYTIFILSFLASVTFSSCKKDKAIEPGNRTPTVASLLGTYKLTAVSLNNVNIFDNSNTDLNWYDPCDRDDLYTLNADLTYTTLDAGMVCSPEDNNQTSSWSLSDNTLTFDGVPCTVTYFNGKVLTFTRTYQGYPLTTTMTKQ